MNALLRLTPAIACQAGPPVTSLRRPPEQDGRWPAIVAALAGLRAARRRSVRIVDAACGDGALLLHALRHARRLGFVAIEGRGIEGAPAQVARARHAAARLNDRAIGVTFNMGDPAPALAEEAEAPADIVLWHGESEAVTAAAVAGAGATVIGDEPAPSLAGDLA